MRNRKRKRYCVLGSTVDSLSRFDLVELIEASIAGKDKVIIGNWNMHALYLRKRGRFDSAYFKIADYFFIDGMPIAHWISLLTLGRERPHRTTWAEKREVSPRKDPQSPQAKKAL